MGSECVAETCLGAALNATENLAAGGFQTPAMIARQSGALGYNVASRMIQSETLSHGQCAYFISIIIVQWADLVICKTRMNSIYHQGMENAAMNFGLVFETILGSFLCYVPALNAVGTRPL